MFSVFDKKIESLMPYLDNGEEFENYLFNGIYKLNEREIGFGKKYDIEKGLDENALNDTFEFI